MIALASMALVASLAQAKAPPPIPDKPPVLLPAPSEAAQPAEWLPAQAPPPAADAPSPSAPAKAAEAAPPAEWLPPQALPPAAIAPASIDLGKTSLAAAAALPTHLATTVATLAFACSGEVIGASCGNSLEGDGGARTASYLLLATVPPLASGAVLWALGDDDEAPSSLLWTLAGGAAGQLAGFGLALATDSPVVGVLSISLFPVAGELAGLLLTRNAPAASGARPPPPR